MSQLDLLSLAVVGDDGSHLTEADREQARRDRERAARDFYGYVRHVHRAFRALRPKVGRAKAPATARPQTRRRGAGRPRAAATRSSAASGDSGDSDSDEPPLAVVVVTGDPAAGDAAVARTFERLLAEERPGTHWQVRR